MVNLKSFYDILPYNLKTLAASAYGYLLYFWRFNKNTEKFVEEALERETWTKNQWRNWQDERLAYILDRAARKVPYYRAYWERQRRKGNDSSWELLSNWPILGKKTVQEQPHAFLAEDCNPKFMFKDPTSGTTGRPTIVYKSRGTVINYSAIFEARLKRWHDVSSEDHWGIFGGKRVISLDRDHPPFWVWNKGLNQIYFSIYHISEKTAQDYINALWKYRPTHLIVYPSSFSELANYVLQQGLEPPAIKVILSNAEKLKPWSRKIIQEAFNCPVFDTYGLAEMTGAASECNDGTLHLWPEVGYLEVLDIDTNYPLIEYKKPGKFIMTGLMNPDMPLIRYKNGDVGELVNWRYQCACQRKLPVTGSIIGREKDLILTADGRKIYLLDSIFNTLPILEIQLEQITPSNFIVRIVPNVNVNKSNLHNEIVKTLSPYLGDIDVDVELTDRIPRDRTGKFKPYISHVS